MKNDLIDQVLEPLLRLKKTESLALHEPDLTGNELAYVTECIKTGWVSSVGKFVDQFEERLAEYVHVPKAVAVVNGTAGLHLALQLVGVKAGEEVLTPALTFVATTNAIAYLGAIPHFVDSGVNDLSVGPSELEAYLDSIVEIKNGVAFNGQTGRKISALVVMHALGHPADMVALKKIADKFALKLVEDAAEALGSRIHDTHVGVFGDIGVFSFNGNKIITTGGGGALVSKDPDLMTQAKHLSTTAKSGLGGSFVHDAVGFNYRMPNINAALGVAQLESLPRFLEKKFILSNYYRSAYSELETINFVEPANSSQSNYWLCAIKCSERMGITPLHLTQAASKQKILLRPLWALNSELPMYSACPQMALVNAKAHVEYTVCLPSSASLGGLV